jgi:PEP-CTERM motif
MIEARRWLLGLLGAAVAAVLSSSPAGAVNLLSNPGFDTPSGSGSTSYTGLNALGTSAAADWLVWNNTLGTTRTEQVASTDPLGGGEALHVLTTGGQNGVYQFVAPNSVARVSVDVYLVSGSFELGLGQQGFYLNTAKTSVLNTWVHLTTTYTLGADPTAPFPDQYGNEIFLYATNGAGAEFYVDNASANSVPEPSTWAMMLAGFAALGVAGSRAGRKAAAAA